VVNIAVIYNCARDELFIFYHGKVTWLKLLQPWTKSSNKAIKLHAVFLLGYLAPSLSQLDHAKLCSIWTKADMKSLFDLLVALSSSPKLTVECNTMIFSAEDIVSNLLNLIHFSKECFAVICKPPLLQPCLVFLQKGTDVVKQLTCQLLWQLLIHSENPLFKDSIWKESALTQGIDSLCCSTNADIALLAQCLKITFGEVALTIGVFCCVLCVCVCACVHLCVCVCVCMFVCVHLRMYVWAHAANLLVVSLEMHHNGLLHYGVANSSSPGLSHVVETRLPLSWPCKPTKGLPMHTFHATQGGPRTRGCSGPCFCPWLTSHHVAYLVKISMLLVGDSVSNGQVGGRVM